MMHLSHAFRKADLFHWLSMNLFELRPQSEKNEKTFLNNAETLGEKRINAGNLRQTSSAIGSALLTWPYILVFRS